MTSAHRKGPVETQPGYDVMADLYATTIPTAYQFPIERVAAAAFADAARGRDGTTVDVGCGLGHVTADLAHRGLTMIGCDPSTAMLDHARRAYPHLGFIEGDATLAALPRGSLAAIIARFSLIHVDPADVADILAGWSQRLDVGGPVLVAFQARDEPGPPLPFNHAVAPAWRWYPDGFRQILQANGFDEHWRIVYRDVSYRLPMCQILACRA